MNEILYPALVADSHGWIQLLEDDAEFTRWTYQGIHNFKKKQKKIYVLDSNDNYWTITNISPVRPLTGFRKFLACKIYNPRISIEYQAHPISGNTRAEFVQVLRVSLENGDDVYTQHSEIEEILAAISSSHSFIEFKDALKSTGAI